MPNNSAATSTRLLLEALHPEQTAVQWTSACAKQGVNWDDLAIRAIVFGLAPQLYYRLEGWGVDVPPRAKAKLKVTYQAQARRNEAVYEQLAEVLSACRDQGLAPIALKGVHLAAGYYPEPALRPMNDIDLLFRPEDLSAAEEILSDLGYGGKHKPAELGPGITKHTSTFKREEAEARTPNPYLSADAGRMVEPHLSLEESWFGLKVDVTPGVWERAQTADLQGHSCLVLSPEDLLLHLCVHFCFHLIMGAPSMVQLADLLVVTRAGTAEWGVFVERAKAQKAVPFALAALHLAARLLKAPVPDGDLEQLARATPPRIRSYILRLDLEHILSRTQQKPLTTIGQRLRRGIEDRAETARWAEGWRGRWRVWRTMLAVGRTDTGRMLLGKSVKG